MEDEGVNQRCKDAMLVECCCGDSDHMMVWKMDGGFYDPDLDPDYPPEFFIDYHLNHHKNFWERIVIAIKYIFGFTSRFGDFGETVLNFNDSCKLMGFLENYKKMYQDWYLKKNAVRLFREKSKRNTNHEQLNLFTRNTVI